MNVVIDHIGGICPVQGYGTIDDEHFYLRYRHDDAQLYVGPPVSENDWYVAEPRLYAEINDVTGDYDRGWLDNDEAEALLHRLIGLLRPIGEWESTGHQRLAATVEALVAAMRKKEQPAEDGDSEAGANG